MLLLDRIVPRWISPFSCVVLNIFLPWKTVKYRIDELFSLAFLYCGYGKVSQTSVTVTVVSLCLWLVMCPGYLALGMFLWLTAEEGRGSNPIWTLHLCHTNVNFLSVLKILYKALVLCIVYLLKKVDFFCKLKRKKENGWLKHLWCL